MVRKEQTKCLLFDYMPTKVQEEMNISTIQAINAAFEKYQNDQEAKQYSSILRLISSGKISKSHLAYCQKWLRMNCNNLTWITYQANFNLGVRFLCVCALKNNYVNDEDIKRVTGWNMKLFMIRSALHRAGLVERQPKTSLVRINKKGRKLLTLVLEAVEIHENNLNLLVQF